MGDAILRWIRRVGAALAVGAALSGNAAGQVQELTAIGHIGGPIEAIAISGNYLYVGEGSSLRIFDLTVPASPIAKGKVLLEAIVNGIAIDGNQAYASGDGKVSAVDISDPDKPTVLAQYEPPPNSYLSMISASSGTVCVFNGNAGRVLILDFRDPTTPSLAAEYIPSNAVGGIFSRGGYVYLSGNGSGGNGRLVTLDVSDPVSPLEIGTVAIPDGSRGLDIAGNFAFIASGFSGLIVIDVSNPQAPLVVGSVDTPSLAFDVVASGNQAFVADNDGGLVAIDVSNPSSPAVLDVLATQDLARDVSAYGGYVYVAARYAGLRVVNASNPAALTEVPPYRPAVVSPNDVAVSGDHAYVVEGDPDTIGSSGLRVIDVSQPRAPALVGSYDTPGTAVRIFIQGSYAYIGGATGGMQVVDISDPTNPTGVGIFDTGGTNAFGVFAAGSYAYLANGGAGLRSIDVSDPANPILLDTANAVDTAQEVFIEGPYAYVAATAGDLRIFDISDPGNLIALGSGSVSGAATTVSVTDGTAFVGDDTGQFAIFDVGDPGSPSLTAVLDIPGVTFIYHVISTPHTVFAACGEWLKIIDVTDLGSPATIAEFSVVSTSVDVHNFAYVVGTGGFYVVPVPPPAPELGPLPTFIDSDTITVSGTAQAGSFVTLGGGAAPRFQQLTAGATAFSIEVELHQEAVNTISVTTMNEFGLVSLPAIRAVVESVAYPSAVTAVTALAVTPSPAGAVALNDTLAFTCTATFSNAAQADVTQFVQWEDIANGEVVTPGGLYLNNKPGTAQLRAFVAGVFSNVVSVADGP